VLRPTYSPCWPVPTTAGRLEADVRLELRRRIVRIGDRDHQVVDPKEHAQDRVAAAAEGVDCGAALDDDGCGWPLWMRVSSHSA